MVTNTLHSEHPREISGNRGWNLEKWGLFNDTNDTTGVSVTWSPLSRAACWKGVALIFTVWCVYTLVVEVLTDSL